MITTVVAVLMVVLKIIMIIRTTMIIILTTRTKDSNESKDRLNDQSPLPTNPYSPALERLHGIMTMKTRFWPLQLLYINSKLFSAAGALFSFNMAAAALDLIRLLVSTTIKVISMLQPMQFCTD